MANYPDVINGVVAVAPYEVSTDRKVLISEYETGIEQRRVINHRALKTINLRYVALKIGDFSTLIGFYNSMSGSYLSFVFIEPDLTAIKARFGKPFDYSQEGPFYDVKVQIQEIL